ncbi:MAG: M28 family peptidase [Flavobacteriales bacterium]
MNRISIVFITLLLAAIIGSCKQPATKPSNTDPTPPEKVKYQAATFNEDSAYFFVKEQVRFGPRVPNTPSHEKCALWLESTMKKYTKDVLVQKFTAKAYNGTVLNLKNIIASFNASNSKRILLCAHWDSRPYADNDPDSTQHKHSILGANDGASGVGVLLEIARQMSKKTPDVGVDIILLDGEDYGAPQSANYQGQNDWALGAQYWANNPHSPAYFAHFGILLDMVGGENAVFTLEGTSLHYAQDIAHRVWSIAADIGHSGYFSTEETQPITDDHLYINQIRQIPTIDIIQHDPTTNSGFYKYWHTVKDDMAGISKPTLLAVGQTVLTVIYAEK